MLFLLIIAIIATPAFYKRSRAIGVHSGKFASMPFLALGIFLVAGHFAGLFVSWIASAVGTSTTLANAMMFMLNAFVLLSYTLVIHAYWIALNRGRSESQ